VRSRILLEIASDLEAVYEHFREDGLSEEAAQRQAIEHCDLSDEAVAELVDVHTSWYRRFLDRFSAQVQTRWERAVVILLLIFVAAVTAPLVVSVRVFEVASFAVWPVLGVTLAAVVMSLRKFYAAYVKQDHDTRRLRSGLSAILVLAGINLLIGLYGCWLALYRAARNAVAGTDQALILFTDWLLSSSAMLMVCFLTVVLIALLWFVLANKISRIEQAEAALLLE
jgi:hypothetical protein